MSKIVLYKCLTHHGVQSNLQEAIELKAKIFISKLKDQITSNYFQFHAFPCRGKQVFQDIQGGGLSKAGLGAGGTQASQGWWTTNNQCLTTKLSRRELIISMNSSQSQGFPDCGPR